MTKGELKILTEWFRENGNQSTNRDKAFGRMQELFEECGGGKASCCLEYNFEYLMTSLDPSVRNRAMHIYADYHSADGADHARSTLAQAFANLWGSMWGPKESSR